LSELITVTLLNLARCPRLYVIRDFHIEARLSRLRLPAEANLVRRGSRPAGQAGEWTDTQDESESIGVVVGPVFRIKSGALSVLSVVIELDDALRAPHDLRPRVALRAERSVELPRGRPRPERAQHRALAGPPHNKAVPPKQVVFY